MKINVSEAPSIYLPLGYFRSCPVSVTTHYQVVVFERGESLTKKENATRSERVEGKWKREGGKKQKNGDVCPPQSNSLIRKQEQRGNEEENLGRRVPRSTTPLLGLIFTA